MKRKVAIIGSVGIPANYGGFETLAERLVIELSSKFDIGVYCSSRAYPEKPRTKFGARMHYIPLRANGWQGVVYDSWSMVHAIIQGYDSLLILGVTGAFVLPFIKMFKVKTIVHIDGIEWKREKWKPFARLFLKLSERISIKYADEIIVDNQALVKNVEKSDRRRGYNLIAYGCDNVTQKFQLNNIYEVVPKREYSLALCRIVPENNVLIILDMFVSNPDKDLVFIGNWEVNSFSKNVYKKYSNYPNIDLRGPTYDQNIIEALRKNCKAYIHGHSAGGTNPSLVEAMGSGAPVIAFDVEFNRNTMNNQGLYFKDIDELSELLNSYTSAELSCIGEKLKGIAQKEYQWAEIAQKYSTLFI